MLQYLYKTFTILW